MIYACSNSPLSSGATAMTITVYGSNTAYQSGAVTLGSQAITATTGQIVTISFTNTTAYRWVWIETTGSSTNLYCAQVQFLTTNSITSMILVTNTLNPAPTSAPTTATIDLLWKDLSGSAVLGTDLTIEVTSNGTNWYSVTPINSGITINGFSLLKATIPLTVSSTSVQIRTKTLNNKSQQIKGIALLVK